jgi:mannose-6-phosphate isomerase-like protein (cupin superfamily)
MQPEVAQPKPYLRELRAGQTILWCRCGRSKRQPYCDGRSHEGTGFEPLRYTAGAEPEEVLLCGCKHTSTPPFCDGTHSNLPGGYQADARSDEERARIAVATMDGGGVRPLDGRCYAVRPAVGLIETRAGYKSRTIIAPSLGAQHQSQVYVEVDRVSSPILSGEGADVILFIARGSGMVEISGRKFPVGPADGVYVRAGEAFRVASDHALTTFISICPAREGLAELESMPENFHEAFPERVKGVDTKQKTEMGPRYFQMLVDKSVGSITAAQFIGHIPPSRAEMHRHLYEESLIILKGRGIIWTEESRAEVDAGDVIFLPRKQIHSLECVDPEGMDVVGVIHPGDNPGINY